MLLDFAVYWHSPLDGSRSYSGKPLWWKGYYPFFFFFFMGECYIWLILLSIQLYYIEKSPSFWTTVFHLLQKVLAPCANLRLKHEGFYRLCIISSSSGVVFIVVNSFPFWHETRMELLSLLNISFEIPAEMVCSSQNWQNSPILAGADSQNKCNGLISAGTDLLNPVWWLITLKSYFMGIKQTSTDPNKNLMGILYQ